MAKNQNTFEKRRREIEKKQRAEEKRRDRRMRKEHGDQPIAPAQPPLDDELLDAETQDGELHESAAV